MKENIQRKHESSRSFTYGIGAVNLQFRLSTDEPSEMESFLRLLNEAVKDVSKELAKIKCKP